MKSLKRIRCWWRGYHRESPTIGYFRFDVGGMCSDCGKVGDGINHNDDPPPQPFAFGLTRGEVWRLVRGIDG